MVSVSGKTATRTPELSFGECQGLSMPTLGAILTGVARIYSNELPASILSFVKQAVFSPQFKT